MRPQKEAFDIQLRESEEHSLALSEHLRTLMSLTTEFERSFSARLNSGLQVLDNRLSETLDTSRFSLIEQGLLSSMNLIVRLATSVNHLSDALNSSAHEVALMNIAQANAVRSIGANLYSFSSIFLSLASAVVLSLKQISLLHLVASTVIRLLWSTLQHIPSFVVMPFAVAVISVLRWFLPKILPRRSFYSRPYRLNFLVSRTDSAWAALTIDFSHTFSVYCCSLPEIFFLFLACPLSLSVV
ncbi:hypothetical protein F5888DRAFT_955497 [Russula emetica]|nr:hypothetical protein F5888DRAFT_955497 [Russula emetica]